MRLVVILALLLPANLGADSYWQRFKNYIAYYLIGKPISVTQPTQAIAPMVAPIQQSLTTRQLLDLSKRTYFYRPIMKSPPITTLKGTLGEVADKEKQRTTEETIETFEKPRETNGPTVPEKSKSSEINFLQPFIIQERIIDGYNVIQLQVAEQTANYCGYHALKNAIGIASALYFNDPKFLNSLQEDTDKVWIKEIQNIRKTDDVEWLTQEEIYKLINKFATGNPYTITAIEDINRLRVGEGLVPQTMIGLVKAQKHLETKQKYIQAFIVGTMNQETNRAGHWVTVVLWIHERIIKFIIADSLYNRPFYDRPTTLEFIRLLTHMDFKVLAIIASEEMQQYQTRLNLISAILQKKEYARQESGRSVRKDLPIYNIPLENLPTLAIDTIEDFIKVTKRKAIFSSPAFANIKQFLTRTLHDLKQSHEIRFKAYSNTGENSFSIEYPLQIQDYQWDIIEDLLQQLS